jgi:LIVCS family branched-chain amino acid:cation transporter
MFIVFIVKGEKGIADPINKYLDLAFLQGFVDGYQTMDTIAALNFGLVIVIIINNFGIKEEKKVVKHIVIAGIIAGTILTLVYSMLTAIGSASSSIYEGMENGALILRQMMFDLLGGFGALLLAAIFTLACITTCVGLTNSISTYFNSKFNKISYTKWVIIITVISFLICNLGLNMILSISIPVLNAIYPVSIVLIILGLCDKFIKNNKYVYKMCIYSTAIISVIYAVDQLVNLGVIENILSYIPLYSNGFGWVIICIIMFLVSIVTNLIVNNKKGELEG